MVKYATVLVVVALLVSTSSAQVPVQNFGAPGTGQPVSLDFVREAQVEILGVTYNAFTFYCRTTDGLQRSWTANLGFQGWDLDTGAAANLKQTKSGTTVVNFEGWIEEDPEAPGEYLGDGWVFFKDQAGFNEKNDTWTFNPFAPIPGSNPIPGGPALTSGYGQNLATFAFSLGTAEGSQFGDMTPIAYVLSTKEVRVYGQLARGGADIPVSGVTPEPATMAMLSMGVVALLRRRR